jgi:hypothetical protein
MLLYLVSILLYLRQNFCIKGLYSREMKKPLVKILVILSLESELPDGSLESVQ